METVEKDSRYSWVVAASCCLVTFVIHGLVRCGGVIYVALIDTYGVNRAQASWPFTLRLAMWNLSGPIAGALSYRWSIPSIIFTSVLLVTATNVLCWFVSDINIITLLLGGVQGFGVGMVATLAPVIANECFSKYKSTGVGIASTGATIGSFALPPLVEYAIEEYGLRGSFLIMGGITLHGILGAALMRPASRLKRENVSEVKSGGQHIVNSQCDEENLNFLKSRSSEKSNNEEMKNPLYASKTDQYKLRSESVTFTCDEDRNIQSEEDESYSLIGSAANPPTIAESCSSKQLSANEGHAPGQNMALNHLASVLENIADNSVETVRHEKLEFADNNPQTNSKLASVQHLAKNGDCISSPSSNPGEIFLIPGESRWKTQESPVPNSSFQRRKWVYGIMEPIKAAYQILKNPVFLIIASNYSVFFLLYMTYLIVIVDHSLDIGVDSRDAVFLVSAFSIGDLCGRLGSGWITDSGIVKRKHFMMGNMLTIGGLLIATSFTSTYVEVTAVSASCGLVVGVNVILFCSLLEEYLGLSKMAMAVGLMNFFIGVIYLATPLLTGYFRDTIGSYNHLFHLLGTLTIVCGCLWVFEPVYTRRNKKKTQVYGKAASE